MPLYFAYGGNMDTGAMAARCPRSRALNLGWLMRHRLAVMREGWLTVVRDPTARVPGVLWDIALADIGALDRYEGVGEGLYAKIVQPIVTTDGPKRALIYVGANAGPGRANVAYIREVIAAARDWRLPREGLDALEKLAREIDTPPLRENTRTTRGGSKRATSDAH